jgi:hypothetical protein
MLLLRFSCLVQVGRNSLVVAALASPLCSRGECVEALVEGSDSDIPVVEQVPDPPVCLRVLVVLG